MVSSSWVDRASWALTSFALGWGCVVPLSSPKATAGPGQNDGGMITGSSGSPTAGPIPGSWTNVTSNLANMASQCGNVQGVFEKPEANGGDVVIAGIALDGLWSSANGGGTWQQLGTASPAAITNRPMSLVVDPMNAGTFWESGLYNGGGVYRSDDDGATFTPLGDITGCDLVSVDFSDPMRQTLVAGGHEQAQKVRRSIDRGMTWSDIVQGLPTDVFCSYPLVIDANTYLVGCYAGTASGDGVYRTTDGGMHWTQITMMGGGSAPLWASDGTIYWANADSNGMVFSTDKGQTWKDLGVRNNVISSVHPIELPNGHLATIGPEFSNQSVVVSADHGATWRSVTPLLPYRAVGVVYSAQQKAFFIWYFTCATSTDPVPADGIMRFNFDYAAK